MKPQFHRHSCPNCGHRVNWTRLHLRAWSWARWRCESCGSELCIDSGRRWLCPILCGLWCGFLGFWVYREVQWWVWAVLLCVGSIAVFRLERIRLVQAHTRQEICMHNQRTPPDKLDTQVPELQCGVGTQFFTSLLRRRGGWVANHALQRLTRPSRAGCNPRLPQAGSLSLSR